MTDYDLETLSLAELRKLDKNVARAISTFEDRQKADARAKVEAFCKEMGYSLAELVGHDAKPKRIPAAPKYQHPENTALTWSGRGRRPLWFIEALEAGKTADDLAICRPARACGSSCRRARPFSNGRRRRGGHQSGRSVDMSRGTAANPLRTVVSCASRM